MLHELHESFVGVDHLFEVYAGGMHEGEGCVFVEIIVQGAYFIGTHVGKAYSGCDENSTREIASHRNETQFGVAAWLEVGKRHAYFLEVLVIERLVYRQVVVSPAEMCCGTGLYACSGRTGDAGDCHVAVQPTGCSEGQKSELYGRGEAAGVGHFGGLRMRSRFTSGSPYT